ncbi:MAG TPA: SDR family oxidoreductase [Vicinamibacterales bacterium]|jgi:nucleoside-diphosphate-sugar epimerase|nr:SDR family oxidoreductase [Vicinamibacterales bacterium]
MAILVTGGCGYIGTRLTEALLARTDDEITVLDTAWFGNHLQPHPRLTVHVADVRASDRCDLSSFDTIFHLAGIANDPSADLNPYGSWDVNVLATMRLADRAARGRVRQFIFPSSGAVYGVRSEPRITEDLDLMPISDYNKTKMVAERVILSYGDRMVTTILRTATVCGYSPRMRLDLTVNLLTMQALSTGAITVFGGNQVRPNIHIDDLVDVYLFARERRLAGVYNAAFENLTVLEIARLVAGQVPARIDVQPSNDPRSYRLCSDRLLATGFAPKKNVAIAVGELAEAYREGRLTDQPAWHTTSWMKAHNLG